MSVLQPGNTENTCQSRQQLHKKMVLRSTEVTFYDVSLRTDADPQAILTNVR